MEFILWLIVLVAVVGAGVFVWSRKSYFLAKALGQPESRIKAELERRKR